jgi:hypothetical protein
MRGGEERDEEKGEWKRLKMKMGMRTGVVGPCNAKAVSGASGRGLCNSISVPCRSSCRGKNDQIGAAVDGSGFS